ncbi:DUF3761 domain-containing protein [Aquitalea sp. LB_tupeE]|uniref:DUF3761 domain-containing protein n=1 Tax=Aquitalea sp. LB_tupeE TaxID=2748078 RepID=UPI0015C1882B|nr:DUF3761 domain-containing protein [Aquitalea sp. LB_tupeE]NWK79573.1 DUF3761 domain-containing protein [Aquitalea sp. LB_tupeE]
MNRAILLLLATLACPLTYAKAPAAAGNPPDETQLIEHGSYTNKDGNAVHRPAHSKSGQKPQGATAQCRDGSYSFSQHHRGTCSRHGGVLAWLG